MQQLHFKTQHNIGRHLITTQDNRKQILAKRSMWGPKRSGFV